MTGRCTVPPGVLTGQAKMYEQAGLEGLFAPQVYGPPFVPLAAAAAVTTRVKLASGIALAFARSPFETAMAAIDLDRLSGGRFTLGLGCSIRSWSEGFFGMPYGKPLEHLREVVELIRLIIAKAHSGVRLWLDTQVTGIQVDAGSADVSSAPARPSLAEENDSGLAGKAEPFRTSGRQSRISGVMTSRGFISTRVVVNAAGAWASEVAKMAGAELHRHMSSAVMPKEAFILLLEDSPRDAELVERELRRGGIGFVSKRLDTEKAFAEAINDSRATIAFYAGMTQYEEYFAAHGFRKEAQRLQEGVKRGDYLGVAHLVPDEMVEAFVTCGPADDVRKRIEPLWDIADSLCPVPAPYGLPAQKVLAYGGAIASTFYG